MCICNQVDGLPMGRLRLSRWNLRRTLLDSYIARGEGQISFNKQCNGVKTGADGRVALTFQVAQIMT